MGLRHQFPDGMWSPFFYDPCSYILKRGIIGRNALILKQANQDIA